jgi:hypothetical protein
MWTTSSLEVLGVDRTSVPSLMPSKGDLINIGRSLLAIATKTEKTVEQFTQDKLLLDDAGRYY